MQLPGIYADTKKWGIQFIPQNGVGFKITTSIAGFKQPIQVLKVSKKYPSEILSAFSPPL